MVNGKYKIVNVKLYKCEIIILFCYFYILMLKFILFIVYVCIGNIRVWIVFNVL